MMCLSLLYVSWVPRWIISQPIVTFNISLPFSLFPCWIHLLYHSIILLFEPTLWFQFIFTPAFLPAFHLKTKQIRIWWVFFNKLLLLLHLHESNFLTHWYIFLFHFDLFHLNSSPLDCISSSGAVFFFVMLPLLVVWFLVWPAYLRSTDFMFLFDYWAL